MLKLNKIVLNFYKKTSMYLIKDWVACHVKYINSNIPPFRDYTKNKEQQISSLMP